MKILLAEDDANIVKIASLVLTKVGGHHVDVATDGEEALTKALQGDYDLLILDGMMPKYQGIEVCRKYFEQKQPPHARVIFLSAKSNQDDIKEFKRLGSGFIQKPFEPQRLCQQIDEILQEAA